MFIPSAVLSVVLKNGTRYDARLILPTWRDGDLKPQISILCSGRMISFDAADVERVEYWFNPEVKRELTEM